MVAPLTPKVLRETIRFLDAAGGNVLKAAKLAGLSRSTFRERLATARRAGLLAVAPKKLDPAVAKRVEDLDELQGLRKEVEILRAHIQEKQKVGRRKPFPKAVKRSGKDDFVRMVLPDSHGSHIDQLAFAAVQADMRSLQPDEIVHLGDYMDCGGFLSAHHTIGYVAQLDEVSYEEDLSAWHQQLDAMQDIAAKAAFHLLEGNHLQRIERWAVEAGLAHKKNADFLRKAICPEFRLDYKKRGINYYKDGDFHHGLPVRGTIKLGQCLYTHGIAVGPNAARRHAERFGMPVAYGHTHAAATHYGKTVGNGLFAAWSPGCLCKFSPRYMHTNPDNWRHGYLLQIVSRQGNFLTIDVPIMNGVSLLPEAFRRVKA